MVKFHTGMPKSTAFISKLQINSHTESSRYPIEAYKKLQ